MKKTFNRITEAEKKLNSVSSLGDRPNISNAYGKGGLSASELKAWFDKLSELLIARLNVVIDGLSNEGDTYVGLTSGGSLYDFIAKVGDATLAAELKAYLNEADEAANNPTALQAIIYSIQRRVASVADIADAATRNITALQSSVTANQDGIRAIENDVNIVRLDESGKIAKTLLPDGIGQGARLTIFEGSKVFDPTNDDDWNAILNCVIWGSVPGTRNGKRTAAYWTLPMSEPCEAGAYGKMRIYFEYTERLYLTRPDPSDPNGSTYISSIIDGTPVPAVIELNLGADTVGYTLDMATDADISEAFGGLSKSDLKGDIYAYTDMQYTRNGTPSFYKQYNRENTEYYSAWMGETGPTAIQLYVINKKTPAIDIVGDPYGLLADCASEVKASDIPEACFLLVIHRFGFGNKNSGAVIKYDSIPGTEVTIEGRRQSRIISHYELDRMDGILSYSSTTYHDTLFNADLTVSEWTDIAKSSYPKIDVKKIVLSEV